LGKKSGCCCTSWKYWKWVWWLSRVRPLGDTNATQQFRVRSWFPQHPSKGAEGIIEIKSHGCDARDQSWVKISSASVTLINSRVLLALNTTEQSPWK
jgi:hypothetical protein